MTSPWPRTFLCASQENQKTPEFLLNSQPRGALSWAFAQALRGLPTPIVISGWIVRN
ncbi:MAG: hypothetical protein IPK63_23505 [Candidatus Competibacteraceae bacterium]|nr:hypothetical protein [Candidatus Competibacteraceae bacterium]